MTSSSTYMQSATNSLRENLHANDPSIRNALEQYFDGRNGMVEFGSDEDYSSAFELALPEESSRRVYLRNLLKDASPAMVSASSAPSSRLPSLTSSRPPTSTT